MSKQNRQDSYWVEVKPDVARWLDGNGLMKAHLDSSGSEVLNPLFVGGVRLGEVLASPFLRPGAAPQVEGMQGRHPAFDLREVSKITLSDEKGRVFWAAGSNAERNSGTHHEHQGPVIAIDGEPKDFARLDLGEDLVQHVGVQVVAANADDLPAIDDVGHETSPLVGAPSGAGVGTFKPTGGDRRGGPVAAGRPTREQCIQEAGAVLARALQLYGPASAVKADEA